MVSSDQERRSGSIEAPTDNTAGGVTGWLCLAAAPTFAVMAIVALTSGADMVCSAMQGPFPLDGMTTMYLLMCLFHLPPWLRLISGRAVLSERA
ncbi:hypothetical protein [Rhizobium mesoamericanum]|uniref:hypothetical protein n=1 Tax=Rhizobium mesoamericanum TaxID=1079800 RepID=UPI000424972D|nr:hypothetical protein [Rhizobium mesoamericanum]